MRMDNGAYRGSSLSEKETMYISHMQCRLFRMAQKNWNKTPEETISLFQQHSLFGYIADYCDYFLLNGCQSGLSLLEILLKKAGVDDLTMSDNEICDPNEDCAIMTMRCMLQEYAQEKDISFLQALTTFAASTTYAVLFDCSTAVWKEGPDYLRCLFEEASRK